MCELSKHANELAQAIWSCELSKHLCKEHAYEFELWWDPNKFDWNVSSSLTEYCFSYFDKWWDPEKFNWKFEAWTLARYCSSYFDMWWSPLCYNKIRTTFLITYCSNYFHKWWPVEKNNVYWPDDSWFLAKYCSQYFHEWWDPNKFDWGLDKPKGSLCGVDGLLEYCFNYAHIWLPQLLARDERFQRLLMQLNCDLFK